VTAVIVAFAVVATSAGGSGHRDSIVPPATKAPPTMRPDPTAAATPPPPSSRSTPPAATVSATSTVPVRPAPDDGRTGDLLAVVPTRNLGEAAPAHENALMLISASTGATVRVLAPPLTNGTLYINPVVGPSGRFVYFYEAAGTSGSGPLLRIPVTGGDAVTIPVDLPAGHPASVETIVPSPDDASVVLDDASSGNGPSAAFLQPTAGGKARQLAGSGLVAGWLPDGKTLITTSTEDKPPAGSSSISTSVARYDIASGTTTPLASVSAIYNIGTTLLCAPQSAVAVSAQGVIAIATGGSTVADCNGPIQVSYGPSMHRRAIRLRATRSRCQSHAHQLHVEMDPAPPCSPRSVPASCRVARWCCGSLTKIAMEPRCRYISPEPRRA
jgi:hypothetical protein